METTVRITWASLGAAWATGLRVITITRKEWDRFSWFGFRSVLAGWDDYPLHKLGAMANVKIVTLADVITDVESLLIRAMGLSNSNQMNFTDAEEWYQVKSHEIDKYLGRFS
jgi:hypothetical protein